MIISRTPLRVSLFGGGTDLCEYFSIYGSHFFNFAINKYIYISLHPLPESSEILLKYSKTERIANASQIAHPVFREVFTEYNLKKLDISVSSDVPAKTGLGSSSAFTVGLINVVRGHLNLTQNPLLLVKEACKIEIEKLGEPIGVQDQNAVAHGGAAKYEVLQTGKTIRNPLDELTQFKETVLKNFILIRVPGNRVLKDILGEQKNNIISGKTLEYLHLLRQQGSDSIEIVKSGAKVIGENIQIAWNLKKKLAKQISNSYLDSVIQNYISDGFYGAKLLGAGQSGFILLIGPEKKINAIRQNTSVQSLSFDIDEEGSKIIYSL